MGGPEECVEGVGEEESEVRRGLGEVSGHGGKPGEGGGEGLGEVRGGG